MRYRSPHRRPSTVSFHAEVRTAVQFEHIHFLEAARVEQHVDAFASRVLAFGMLFFDAFSPPPMRALARNSTNSLIFSVWTLIICFIFCFKKKALNFPIPKKTSHQTEDFIESGSAGGIRFKDEPLYEVQ